MRDEACFLRPIRRMAKDKDNQGGPTVSKREEPTSNRSHRNAQSRDELQERSVKGERPGLGRRNGSDKQRNR
jgi:hypothetical protein